MMPASSAATAMEPADFMALEDVTTGAVGSCSTVRLAQFSGETEAPTWSFTRLSRATSSNAEAPAWQSEVALHSTRIDTCGEGC